jgi:hypothetical protein
MLRFYNNRISTLNHFNKMQQTSGMDTQQILCLYHFGKAPYNTASPPNKKRDYIFAPLVISSFW